MTLAPLTESAPHRDLFYPPHSLPDSLLAHESLASPTSLESEPAVSIELEPMAREVELELPPRQGLEATAPEPPPYVPDPTTVKTIQRYFTAYEFQDREAMEHLLTRDFSFSSPLNPRIDRATYFRECWPMTPQQTLRIERLFEKDAEAFVTYECQRTDGTYVQKTGFFILRDEQIRHLHIYCDSALDMMPGA